MACLFEYVELTNDRLAYSNSLVSSSIWKQLEYFFYVAVINFMRMVSCYAISVAVINFMCMVSCYAIRLGFLISINISKIA